MSEQGTDGADDADLLAAEYALGVLEGDERLEAERRMLADPGFARATEAWQMRLAGLAQGLPEEPAPVTLWARIAQRLDDGGAVIELRLRRALALWRGAAGVAAAVAAVLAVVLVWPRPAAVPQPLLAAKLTGSRGAAVFVVMFDPAQKRMVLAPASVTAAPGRSPELWLIPTGGKPIPLGVATFQKTVQFSPRTNLAASGAELAVSIEPEGGSPTGQPTGPVVATGKLETL